jgi:hypothetical protein
MYYLNEGILLKMGFPQNTPRSGFIDFAPPV